MFEKVNVTPTLSDQVAQALLKEIESGQLPPGAKLPPEATLAPKFGVSRTVVREAISRLKHDGLLDGRQGSGVFVTSQARMRPLKIDATVLDSPDTVLQIVELRRAIESEVAAVAAQRRSAAELGQIENALHAIDVEVAAGGEGVAPDVAFHRIIAQSTGNPYFLNTLDFLGQYVSAATMITRANEARRPDFASQVKAEHIAIVEAIRRSDAQAARAAAQTHMLNAARRVMAAQFESN